MWLKNKFLKKYKNIFFKEKFKLERKYVKRWLGLFIIVNIVEIKIKGLYYKMECYLIFSYLMII